MPQDSTVAIQQLYREKRNNKGLFPISKMDGSKKFCMQFQLPESKRFTSSWKRGNGFLEVQHFVIVQLEVRGGSDVAAVLPITLSNAKPFGKLQDTISLQQTCSLATVITHDFVQTTVWSIM